MLAQNNATGYLSMRVYICVHPCRAAITASAPTPAKTTTEKAEKSISRRISETGDHFGTTFRHFQRR